MKSISTGIRLVIFDLDGTLIDSQPLQHEAFNTIFSQYGYPISREEWIKYWIHQSCTAQQWIKMKGLNLDHEEIVLKKRRLYEKLIKEKLELKPGALELIKRLHRSGRPLCIASATHIDVIRIILKKLNIEKYFTKVISDVDVKRRKPAPDVFLAVAKSMNTHTINCIVIEDSLAGLQAAKAAHMECIICPDTFTQTPHSKFKEADLIISSLEELLI
jgi:HAD superfamily hydrolase (TIGR01509 family)